MYFVSGLTSAACLPLKRVDDECECGGQVLHCKFRLCKQASAAAVQVDASGRRTDICWMIPVDGWMDGDGWRRWRWRRRGDAVSGELRVVLLARRRGCRKVREEAQRWMRNQFAQLPDKEVWMQAILECPLDRRRPGRLSSERRRQNLRRRLVARSSADPGHELVWDAARLVSPLSSRSMAPNPYCLSLALSHFLSIYLFLTHSLSLSLSHSSNLLYSSVLRIG